MKKITLIAFLSIVLLITISLSYSKEVSLLNERPSPYDHIKENQIVVYDNYVIIKIPGVSWTSYTDTNSMDPVLDKESNGLEIEPKEPKDIHIGDIVAYESQDSLIVHRIIDIKEDSEGIYYVLKGDNSPIEDPEKVRFEQIKYLLVGVIY